MPQAKTEATLQFSECCAAEIALQHWLFCSADVILTKSCAAASKKLQCNIEKAALQKSGALLPLSCGFQAPTFRHPRLGTVEWVIRAGNRLVTKFVSHKGLVSGESWRGLFSDTIFCFLSTVKEAVRENLKRVEPMVFGKYCGGVFSGTAC